MNIKILDSWLREYSKTKASAKQIAEILSLSSVSVERLEKFGEEDYVYDIEITTNRPDLMSVTGLAREASAILVQSGIDALYIAPKFEAPKEKLKDYLPIRIVNDPKLVNRIMAVVMEVNIKESPAYVKQRLEASGIRSLNNLIDVTNYVMRETGHPTHVFDYDRLTTKKLIVRESKKGEKITTLDEKTHDLIGGDIVADNGKGEIIDLLGVMGTANSVVTQNTKKILFFIDNNDPHKIRRTSMSLGIRSEAAVLNEKGVDPELVTDAMFTGIRLYEQIADAKVLSEVIDIYPNKPERKNIKISQEKINKIIGIDIPEKISENILKKLGFGIEVKNKNFLITVPSWRNLDIDIEEDIVEEIARVYGYHKLPNIIPPISEVENYHISNDPFYWEKRVKNTLKYWGFTEVYTYSMVSRDLLEGPSSEAVEVANPLNEDMVYMRKTLVPSLLQITRENRKHEEIKIFELANTYIPIQGNLPNETLTLAAVIKKENITFYEAKGIVEQLLFDIGISSLSFKSSSMGGEGASVCIEKDYLGEIEILDQNTADFELNFEIIRKYATLKKVYKPIPKFPPVIEDVRITTPKETSYEEIVSIIKNNSDLVENVSLLDVYENKKTFRIKYQDPQKTLTDKEVEKERNNIYGALEKKIQAKIT